MPEVKRFKGLVYDLPSEDYHSNPGTYSSSQLKDMLKDEELFYKKYIEKSIVREENSAFDVGTYFHTAILEGHKLEEDCCVYEGVRRGKEWEAFKEANKNKCIITRSELEKANNLIEAVKNSPIAMNRIAQCQAEVSVFVDVWVLDGDIYTENFADILGRYGWEPADKPSPKDRKRAVLIPLKARADAICDDFILDLKSFSGNSKEEYDVKQAITTYGYQTSAALYLDLFSVGKGLKMTSFLWTFASKEYRNSKTWEATEENILIGRARWKKAVTKLAYNLATNWQFEDTLGYIGPQNFEREYLQPKAEDLL